MPETAEEVEDVTRLYRAAGFPGCAGSVDCVHVHHGLNPASGFEAYQPR